MPTSGGGVSGMATLITDIGSVLTGLLTNVGSVCTALFDIDIVKYVLLLSIAVGLVFATIRVVKRFTGRRKI